MLYGSHDNRANSYITPTLFPHIEIAQNTLTPQTTTETNIREQYYQELLSKAKEINNQLKQRVTIVLDLFERINNREQGLEDNLTLHATIAQQTLIEFRAIGITIAAMGAAQSNNNIKSHGEAIAQECEAYNKDLSIIPQELKNIKENLTLQLITPPLETTNLPNIIPEEPEIKAEEAQPEQTITATEAPPTIEAQEPTIAAPQQEAQQSVQTTLQENDSISSLQMVSSNIKRTASHLKNKLIQSQLKPAKLTQSTIIPIVDVNPIAIHTSPHHHRILSHDKINNIHRQTHYCSKKVAGAACTLLILIGLTTATIYYASA